MILTGVKSLSYAANMQATRLAKAQGADEAVLVLPDGTVLEPPTSSIFWVSPQGGLRTPALDVGVLESITRDRLVKALRRRGGRLAGRRPARRAARPSSPRPRARSRRSPRSTAPICPAAPGPRTREAQEAFAATLEQEL